MLDAAERPSGLARRLAALCYDALLLLALLAVLTALLIGLRGGAAIPPGTWWFQALVVGVCVLFYAWFWTHGGQTLGMRAWRIQVLRNDGTALRWRDALLRFGAAWLAVLPAGWGFWSCLLDAEKRCWHDRLTRTRVREIPATPKAATVNEP
ncbi:MAG TPA: RDD family protein [Gammaproteobacteria bacterium]